MLAGYACRVCLHDWWPLVCSCYRCTLLLWLLCMRSCCLCCRQSRVCWDRPTVLQLWQPSFDPRFDVFLTRGMRPCKGCLQHVCLQRFDGRRVAQLHCPHAACKASP
jgi:hypothetical protein